MSARKPVTVIDCKECGKRGIGPLTELRRFGWRDAGDPACPSCSGASSLVPTTTTEHFRLALE